MRGRFDKLSSERPPNVLLICSQNLEDALVFIHPKLAKRCCSMAIRSSATLLCSAKFAPHDTHSGRVCQPAPHTNPLPLFSVLRLCVWPDSAHLPLNFHFGQRANARSLRRPVPIRQSTGSHSCENKMHGVLAKKPTFFSKTFPVFHHSEFIEERPEPLFQWTVPPVRQTASRLVQLLIKTNF